MGKVFNDLAYSNYVPTYAGLPIAEADEAAGVLENRFYQNKDAADKLEIAIANLDVHENDNWIKDEAYKKLKGAMQSTMERGDYENASLLVRNEAKDFATNQGIMNALKSAQGKSTQIAAATERIGKSEEENGILPEDLEHMQALAENNYKGVYKDPKTGAWKGHWSMGKIPKYINMGERIDKFLDDFKPDTYIGRMVTKDGKSRVMRKEGDKFMWVEEQTTKDGSYIYQPTTEEVPYEQVYQAARQHLLQDGEVKSRMAFDASKDPSTFTEFAATTKQPIDDARKAMKDDLKNIVGFTDDQLKDKSDEELYAMWKQENVVYNAISGTVAKHSYVKETATSFGMPFWAKQALKATSKAKSSGGDKETVVADRIIHQHLSQGFSNVNNPTNLREYNAYKVAANQELEKHQQSIKLLQDEITQIENSGGTVPEALQQRYENMMVKRDAYAAEVAEADKWLEYVTNKLSPEEKKAWGAAAKEDEELRATKTGSYLFDFQSRLDAVASGFGVDPHEATTTMGTGKAQWTSNASPQWIADHFITSKTGNKQQDILKLGTQIKARLKNQGKLTPELEQKIDAEIKSLHTEYTDGTYFGNIDNSDVAKRWGKHHRAQRVDIWGKNINKKISKAMKKTSDARTMNYAYVDLSGNPTGKGMHSYIGARGVSGGEVSMFSNSVTNQIRNNPNSFALITKDGKAAVFQGADGEYNPNAVVATGLTTEYVPGHGYLIRALEYPLDKKGNPTATDQPKEIFLKPKTAALSSTIRATAVTELKKGMLAKNQQLKEGFNIDERNVLIDVWQHDEVDQQLSLFSNYPVELPDPKKGEDYKELTKDVHAGRYHVEITRRVGPSGEITWDANYLDRKTKESQYERDYSNIVDVQLDIERLTTNDAFALPLSDLQKIYNTDLTFGNLNTATYSAPYMNPRFFNEFKALETTMALDYNIHNVLRSKYANEQLQGGENNVQLYGKGIDIIADDDEGRNVKEWLDQNSTGASKGPRKIDGTNLYYKTVRVGGKKIIEIYMK